MGAGELWKQRPVSNPLTVMEFPSHDAVMEMSFLNECQKDMKSCDSSVPWTVALGRAQSPGTQPAAGRPVSC